MRCGKLEESEGCILFRRLICVRIEIDQLLCARDLIYFITDLQQITARADLILK